MPEWAWALTGVIGFVGASFFFALAESSLFGLGKWRARQMAQQQPHGAAAVVSLLESPQDLLATILLGNMVANAAIIALVFWAGMAAHWAAGWYAVAMVGLFVLLLLGGEVVPKTLALGAPEKWSRRVARPMQILVRLTRPLRQVAQGANALVLRTLVPRSFQVVPGLTDEEYQEMAELAAQSGALAESEKEMIFQILRLDQRTVKDVMRPRSQMACLPDDLTIEQMLEAARQHRHRRLPLYDETPDTIVGILHTRVLLLDPQVDLSEAIEFPSFVPESMNLLQLLRSLQRQHRGMAIVLDEYGGTAGLVTLEDILAELIGRTRSESEEQGFVMERLGEGRWRVNGTMRLEDFRREYAGLGELPDVDTVGGLVVHLAEHVPAVGQAVTHRGLKLTVAAGDERRVREVLVEAVGRKGGR